MLFIISFVGGGRGVGRGDNVRKVSDDYRGHRFTEKEFASAQFLPNSPSGYIAAGKQDQAFYVTASPVMARSSTQN